MNFYALLRRSFTLSKLPGTCDLRLRAIKNNYNTNSTGEARAKLDEHFGVTEEEEPENFHQGMANQYNSWN